MKRPGYTPKTMEPVTVIVPVKDEEVGLNFLLEDFGRSSLKDLLRYSDLCSSSTLEPVTLRSKSHHSFQTILSTKKKQLEKGSAMTQAIENGS